MNDHELRAHYAVGLIREAIVSRAKTELRQRAARLRDELDGVEARIVCEETTR